MISAKRHIIAQSCQIKMAPQSSILLNGISFGKGISTVSYEAAATS